MTSSAIEETRSDVERLQYYLRNTCRDIVDGVQEGVVDGFKTGLSELGKEEIKGYVTDILGISDAADAVELEETLVESIKKASEKALTNIAKHYLQKSLEKLNERLGNKDLKLSKEQVDKLLGMIIKRAEDTIDKIAQPRNPLVKKVLDAAKNALKTYLEEQIKSWKKKYRLQIT